MSESKPLPVVDYLKIPDDGDPYLEGYRCKKCGSTYLGERNVCSKCFARNEMEVIKLSETGILHSYAIVFRSFPGIDVPYICLLYTFLSNPKMLGIFLNNLSSFSCISPSAMANSNKSS